VIGAVVTEATLNKYVLVYTDAIKAFNYHIGDQKHDSRV